MKKRADSNLPNSSIKGLFEHGFDDGLSGFFVFLLALPLSLGIAKASDFPPVMGLLTAMIGGLLVSFLSGSALTIKGPAAGLIVIVAGAVAEFGQGNSQLGWQLALGAIVVAGILQVFFGLFRVGTIVDLFPLSSIQGMLTAIGIIIFSKQIHVLLGNNPLLPNGKPMIAPIDLVMAIPESLMHIKREAALVGLLSLAVVFLWPKLKLGILQRIPAPLAVLIVAIPVAKYLGLSRNHYVHFEHNLFEIIHFNVSFGGIQHFWIFSKYVLMFALVGSLESLLTVKATDMIDPWKRKSNANKDLLAVGVGNIVSGVLGGLPMISEVARSTANTSNGAKTRWANFYHGLLMMLFLLIGLKFNNLIPIPALAAMLIGVGARLASPKAFGEMAKVGLEQLVVFVTTIIVTLFTDLLIGIAAGVVAKLITQVVLGAPLGAVFKAHVSVKGNEVHIAGAAVFSNWLGIKRALYRMDSSKHVTVNFLHCNLVDYTVIDNLHHLKREYDLVGRSLEVIGLEELEYTGNNRHQQATRNKPKDLRSTLKDAKESIRHDED